MVGHWAQGIGCDKSFLKAPLNFALANNLLSEQLLRGYAWNSLTQFAGLMARTTSSGKSVTLEAKVKHAQVVLDRGTLIMLSCHTGPFHVLCDCFCS